MNTIWKGFSEEVGDFFPPLGVKPCIEISSPPKLFQLNERYSVLVANKKGLPGAPRLGYFLCRGGGRRKLAPSCMESGRQTSASSSWGRMRKRLEVL